MNTGNNTFNNGGKPSFDKETFIGITLCLILMLAWPGISEALGWSTPAPEAETVTETAAPAVNTPAPAPAADNTVKKIGEKTASAEKKRSSFIHSFPIFIFVNIGTSCRSEIEQ